MANNDLIVTIRPFIWKKVLGGIDVEFVEARCTTQVKKDILSKMYYSKYLLLAEFPSHS